MILKTFAALIAMSGAAFAGGSGFPPITMPTMVDGTAPVAASDEPGSALVFPEFVQGSVPMYSGSSGGFTAAQTVIEISAKCPAAVEAVGGCAEQTLRLHGHWVCPGVVNTDDSPSVCPESDWIRTVTFGSFAEGTITFNPSAIPSPSGTDYNGSTVVPMAPCPKGFLLVYVEDSTGHPVKFDGLIGDARLRNAGGGGVAAYKAVAIQADPALANWEASNDGSGISRLKLGPLGALVFDGEPGHYLQTVGQASGQVSWDSTLKAPFHRDRIIFMTLDVKSGLPNTATGVPINFFNKYETQLSDGVAFVCWGEFSLPAISSDLTVELFGSDTGGAAGARTDVGDFRTDQAFDIATGTPRTLLGIERSNEMGDPVTNAGAAQFLREFFNNSVPVPTSFAPKQ